MFEIRFIRRSNNPSALISYNVVHDSEEKADDFAEQAIEKYGKQYIAVYLLQCIKESDRKTHGGTYRFIKFYLGNYRQDPTKISFDYANSSNHVTWLDITYEN